MENNYYYNDQKYCVYKKFNICIIENAFDDNFCNTAINIIDNSKLCKNNYSKGNSVRCFKTELEDLLNNDYYPLTTDKNTLNNIKEKIKNGQSIYLNDDSILIKKEIDNMLNSIEKTFNTEKLFFNKIHIKNNSGYTLRKIYGKTRLHIDGLEKKIIYLNNYCNNIERDYSLIIQLNDDYMGGEFFFPVQDLTIKLKKGSIIIFPPTQTHPHETNELLNNTYRYTINTWGLKKYKK